MYNIPGQVINFITNAMGNWSVELIAEGQILAEVKIQRGFIQEVLLSANSIRYSNDTTKLHRKRTGSNKFSKSQEKIN